VLHECSEKVSVLKLSIFTSFQCLCFDAVTGETKCAQTLFSQNCFIVCFVPCCYTDLPFATSSFCQLLYSKFVNFLLLDLSW
jgi:hypothetical protein